MASKPVSSERSGAVARCTGSIELNGQYLPDAVSRHIGIVACSAEGAALCYRTICAEGAELLGPSAHPEISMHTHALADYVRCIEKNDWPGVGGIMLSSATKLARSGADFLICPDNTIHRAFSFVEPRSPLPWLHIADVVADEALRRGFRRLGIMGTRWLVESDVYPESLAARGLECVRANAGERDELPSPGCGRIVRNRYRANES